MEILKNKTPQTESQVVIKGMKKDTSEVITKVIFFVLFTIIAFICLFPLFWAFNNSLKTFEEYSDDSFAITRSWRFINYVRVFNGVFQYNNITYMGMLWNSLWIVVVKVFVNVAASTMLAYAVAKFRFPGKELLYTVVIFVNTIPIIGSGPAAFKLLDALNMVENPMTIWISWASGFDFAFIVLYGYFKGVSPAYSESAYIDGAGELRIYWQIVMPLVKPAWLTLLVTTFQSVWNAGASGYVWSEQLKTFNSAISTISTVSAGASSAGSVVMMSVPIIIFVINQSKIVETMGSSGMKD